MPKAAAYIFCLCLVLLGLELTSVRSVRAEGQKSAWLELEKGLYLAKFPYSQDMSGNLERSLQDCSQGIIVLKIVPGFFRLHLLSASENQGNTLSLRAWAERFDLHAAINAGMFWKDQQTSTGYMRNFSHINNSIIHQDYGAFLAFNPKDKNLPAIRLIDKKNQPQWREMIASYHTVIQNYRMISSNRENVWAQNENKYSVSAVAMDKENNVLFIFSLKPMSIHGLNKILLRLPLNIAGCMFTEGGETAGLFINSPELQLSCQGKKSNTLWPESAGNFIKIPNIIGIIPRR